MNIRSNWEQVADHWERRAYNESLRADKAERELAAVRSVLGGREKELLVIKGPCSNRRCRLHHAHDGPCDTTSQRAGVGVVEQPPADGWVEDQRPHSRACGWQPHPHGPLSCSMDCPTCHPQRDERAEDEGSTPR